MYFIYIYIYNNADLKESTICQNCLNCLMKRRVLELVGKLMIPAYRLPKYRLVLLKLPVCVLVGVHGGRGTAPPPLSPPAVACRVSTREKHGGVEGWHTADSNRKREREREKGREERNGRRWRRWCVVI